MANFPTKVQVYSDNHGEAMVYLNGNWNLRLSPFNVNGAADVPPGATVGTSTVVAMADYPYFRKHPKIISNNVTKTWTWGGMVLGTDPFVFNNGTPSDASTMILATGHYQITPDSLPYPDEIAFSDKKVVFLWLTDRDISPLGVSDALIHWQLSGGGAVRIAKNFGHVAGISNYNEITRAISLDNGFLSETNGIVAPGTSDTEGISGVRAPTKAEQALFHKFYPTLDPTDFVVGAVELVSLNAMIDVTIHIEIVSKDFGLAPGVSGTIIRNINVDFADAYPLDDKPLYGDANADGLVNMGDVIAVERMILGLKSTYIGADANIDGKLNMGDVIKIERLILGLD
jgi:hypothetical protein